MHLLKPFTSRSTFGHIYQPLKHSIQLLVQGGNCQCLVYSAGIGLRFVHKYRVLVSQRYSTKLNAGSSNSNHNTINKERDFFQIL